MKVNLLFLTIGMVLLLICGISVIASIFFYNYEGRDLQTVSQTQPSKYFSQSKVSLVTENALTGELIINPLNGQFLAVSQAAGTGSMRPAIGDASLLIIIQNFTEEDIHVGDIVLLDRKEYRAVHRIIGIVHNNGTDYYVSKGDNNQDPDPELWTFSHIKAKVVGVLY